MPRFNRDRHGFRHRGRPMLGAIWMIGLGFLFLTGHWWPGILILVGISVVLGAIQKESQPQVFDQTPPPVQPIYPAPSAPVTPQPVNPTTPVQIDFRSDLLPANCGQCGAPVRSHDVKWLNSKSAACSYCGSTLSMKKS